MMIHLSKSYLLSVVTALLLLNLAIGCGDSGTGPDSVMTDTPVIVSNNPGDGANRIPRDSSVRVRFSEEMDPATITAMTFRLTSGEETDIIHGTVVYADFEAVLLPTLGLADNRMYTATVTKKATSSSGVALSKDYSWKFATGSNGESAPTVTFTSPIDGETDVFVNTSVAAAFSEEMDAATLTDASFTLTREGSAIPVDGTVIYRNSTVKFWPAEHLAVNTEFTAKIDASVTASSGVALLESYVWTFTTGSSVDAVAPVDLGEAGAFAILAKTGVSTVPASAVTGDIGVSPVAASYITGFSLIADATNEFSTSSQVTGRIYASDYAPPTPSNLTTAVSAMEHAFTDAAGRAPSVTELGTGDIGGMDLESGVYQWSTGLLIPTDITLTGSATDVWIFQIAQNLTISSGARITLAGGALPENVFWQVAGFVEIGTTAHCEGILISQTAVTMQTGSSINGRLLAQTAVNIGGSTIVEPTNGGSTGILYP